MSKTKFGRTTKTTRELRRIAERDQKRQQRQHAVDAFWALSPEERKRRMDDDVAFQRINRNGITLEDLKMVEEQGRKDGYDLGAENTMKTCYAALCLALNEIHGYDTEACMEVLKRTDEKVTYAISTQELLDDLKDALDIELCFKEAMTDDRIQEIQK